MNNISKKLITAIVTLIVSVVLGVAHAQSSVFVQNDTSLDLEVTSTAVAGDPINKKAWKAGDTLIASGQRKSVLKINRSGKLNWMDPTPRFIEPGKTAIFTAVLEATGVESAKGIKLKQKLLGTGKSSKMWHSIQNDSDKVQWNNDDQVYQGEWRLTDAKVISYSFRIFKSKKSTDIEYIFKDSL